VSRPRPFDDLLARRTCRRVAGQVQPAPSSSSSSTACVEKLELELPGDPASSPPVSTFV
jgi:hypothetical protein